MNNKLKYDLVARNGVLMNTAEFFLDDEGKIVFNEKCNSCERECKQSFRSEVIICKKYKAKTQ